MHRSFALFLLLLAPLSTLQAKDTGWRSPTTVYGTTTIDTATAARLHKQGVPFIDARSERYFKKRHIPGAFSLHLKYKLDEENLLEVASKDDWLVVYGNGIHCAIGYRASERVVQYGFKKIYYYREGFRAWRLAGHPFEKGATPSNTPAPTDDGESCD